MVPEDDISGHPESSDSFGSLFKEDLLTDKFDVDDGFAATSAGFLTTVVPSSVEGVYDGESNNRSLVFSTSPLTQKEPREITDFANMSKSPMERPKFESHSGTSQYLDAQDPLSPLKIQPSTCLLKKENKNNGNSDTGISKDVLRKMDVKPRGSSNPHDRFEKPHSLLEDPNRALQIPNAHYLDDFLMPCDQIQQPDIRGVAQNIRQNTTHAENSYDFYQGRDPETVNFPSEIPLFQSNQIYDHVHGVHRPTVAHFAQGADLDSVLYTPVNLQPNRSGQNLKRRFDTKFSGFEPSKFRRINAAEPPLINNHNFICPSELEGGKYQLTSSIGETASTSSSTLEARSQFLQFAGPSSSHGLNHSASRSPISKTVAKSSFDQSIASPRAEFPPSIASPNLMPNVGNIGASINSQPRANQYTKLNDSSNPSSHLISPGSPAHVDPVADLYAPSDELPGRDNGRINQIVHLNTQKAWDHDITHTHDNDMDAHLPVRLMRFQSIEEAKKASTEHITENHDPLDDSTFPSFPYMERSYGIRLFNAMMDIGQADDNEKMRKQWVRTTEQSPDSVESAAWHTLKRTMDYHRQSKFLRAKFPYPSTLRKFENFEEHISAICEALKRNKTICRHFLGTSYIDGTIDDPRSAINRVQNNRKVNDEKKRKKERLERDREYALRELRAARATSQGGISAADGDNPRPQKRQRTHCDNNYFPN